MATLSEITLLRRFVEHNDQEAFAAIVRGRVDFVYSAALRQVGRDAHLAQDVVQQVFLALAGNARSLVQRPLLGGWLYTTTRFTAAKAVRAHRRWRERHQEAQTMCESEHSGVGEPNWDQLRPVLDAAMHELNERDREAVLLRYFESRPFAEIGAACAITENSARMRVDRALEKLRSRLARRGITSTGTALGLALSAQSVIAAPAGLAAATAAVAGAGATGASLGLITFMSITKAKIVATGVTVAACLAVGVGSFHAGQNAARTVGAEPRAGELLIAELTRLRLENERLDDHLSRERAAASARSAATATVAAGLDAGGERPGNDALAPLRTLSELHHGKVVNAEIAFIGRDGRIGDGFAVLFDLTSVEREALQQAVDRTRKQLEAAVLGSAIVSRKEDGGVMIEIPPSNSGPALYDQLFDSFAQTLGPERNAAFFALGAGQAEKALDRFGTEQRKLTISRNPPQNDGKQTFTLRDERMTVGSSNVFADTMDRAQLGESLGRIATLLPKDF